MTQLFLTNFLTGLFYIVTGFLLLQIMTLLGNVLCFPVFSSNVLKDVVSDLEDKTASDEQGFSRSQGSKAKLATELKVSILIPARNEMKNLPRTLPLLLAQDVVNFPAQNLEIIVLNDNSSDGTFEYIKNLAQRYPQLQVYQGAPLPTGWTGKNWACQQLSQHATGDILIFTDADVSWRPQMLATLLAFRREARANFVSVWPRQTTKTWLERLVVPAIDMILLGWLPYFWVPRTPYASLCAGNGQLMLWQRQTYEAAGGHAAVKNEVLEDVRMGQRAKATGARVALALGGTLIDTRMYQSGREVLEGFSKNILAAVGQSRSFLFLAVILIALGYTSVWLLGFFDGVRWWWLGLLGLLQRGLTAYKTRRNVLEAFWQPLLVFPLAIIAYKAFTQSKYTWKGRQYQNS